MIHPPSIRSAAVLSSLLLAGGCCCFPAYWNESGGQGKSPFESSAPRPTIRLSQQFDDYDWEATETLIISAEDAAASLINDTIRVSPDGRHYAFAKKVEGGAAWIVDGKQLPTMIAVRTLVFTPDGTHYFAGGERAAYTSTPTAIMDGKTVPEPADLQNYSQAAASSAYLSQDGRHVGVSWSNGFYVDGKFAVYSPTLVTSYSSDISWLFADNSQVTFNGKQYQVIGTGTNYLISDNGQSWAYLASQDGKHFAVVNSIPKRRFASIAWSDNTYNANGLVLSPNGKRWGHPAGNLVVIDDRIFDLKGTPARPLAFSPDSKKWTCRLTTAAGVHVVIDGLVGPAYATAGTISENYNTSEGQIAISPDSRHVAYCASRTMEEGQTKNFVILDDEEQTDFAWVSNALVFSPDSQRLAYLARTFGQGDAAGTMSDYFVAIDGKRESDPYPEILQGKIEFSPDSESLGFVGVGAGEALAVLDGQPRTKYDAIAPHGSRFGFTPDNTFTYIAVKGGSYYWVEERRK
jgi:hypothetical protein